MVDTNTMPKDLKELTCQSLLTTVTLGLEATVKVLS